MKKTRTKNWLIAVIGGLLLITVSLAGCGGTSPTPTVPGELSGTITEAGSTTVQPIAEKLANAFTEKHPKVNIIVQGGGSSVGIKSAAQGTVDIGAASRELKPEEKGTVVEHIIARDGIAIIIHPSNPTNGLTRAQVKDIFAGKITRWSQVGGPNKAIHVVAREEGSGTRGAFEELVMGTDLITANAILQPSNGAIRTTVTGDPDSIGFLSFGYLDNSVKTLSIDGVAGTAENARAGTYPVVRPLLFLTRSQPTGLVKAFLDFCLSAEGQAIVVEEGYLPVK